MDSFNPDAFLAQAQQPVAANPQAPTAAPDATGEGFDPDQFLNDAKQEQYGTIGEQVKAGLEGAAQGAVGPLADLAETKLLGVKPEDIRGRAEANPITHGIGQAAGLGAGILTGTGEAAVMTKAGELAAHAAGLGQLAESAPLIYKVGSSAVTQAAEMAVLQGGDEVSKMILQDPDASAQSALANIGLSAALGGATGAAFTGVVNPLWKATLGPKLEAGLQGIKNVLNRGEAELPDGLKQAADTLGVDVGPLIKGANQSPEMMERYQRLGVNRNAEVLDSKDALHQNVSDSIAKDLGVDPSTIEEYSDHTAGTNLREKLASELKEKYEPVAKMLDERDAEAAKISITDEDRLNHYDQFLANAMQKVGTDSPQFKLYQDYGQRFLAKDTLGQIDQLNTELFRSAKTMGKDLNDVAALRDIRDSFKTFQDNQILKQAGTIGKEGASVSDPALERAIALGDKHPYNTGYVQKAEAAKAKLAELQASATAAGGQEGLNHGRDMLMDRAVAGGSYAEFGGQMKDLMSHAGLGDFKGYGTMSKQIQGLDPEQLLKKFSYKGDVDGMNLLQKLAPDTYAEVRQNELRNFLKSSVNKAKGDHAIDVKTLSKKISDTMQGQPEYVKSLLSDQAISKVRAADTLLDPQNGVIPFVKDSGTPGWVRKNMTGALASTMGVISALTGHNPLIGALIGKAGELVQKDAPDAMHLAMLKFVGSDQPIKAEGFKSMVDFMHATYKGETQLAKATTAIFKSGTQVVEQRNFPTDKDREKLDKQVTALQSNPQQLMNHVTNNSLGHYLPNHTQSVAQNTTAAVNYLHQLKPQPTQLSPLDQKIPPTKGQEARYNRALDIATNPMIVLQHVKDGTVQASDIQDLHNMYPAVYQRMINKISNEMQGMQAGDEPIPYKTRMGMSLFMGQPLDSTMSPGSIMAAQPMPKQAPQPQQGGNKKPSAKAANSLEKGAKSFQTAGQQAEADRSDRS